MEGLLDGTGMFYAVYRITSLNCAIYCIQCRVKAHAMTLYAWNRIIRGYTPIFRFKSKIFIRYLYCIR